VDFFSLDVQGAELMVLKTMNWSVPVSVFMVELDGVSPSKDNEVRALLRAHNYHYYQSIGFDQSNELWTRDRNTCAQTVSVWPNCSAHSARVY